MTYDYSKLKPEPKKQRLTDPIALFQKLRVTDTSINDLWLAQGDALRAWNENRAKKDITISLNTGAGKTLVGLLVEQTRERAEGYGIPITTYVRREYSNDLSAQGEAACLTTYQALFNGKSVFANRDIAGIVFDDAHAAANCGTNDG